jgi:tellurium resistance protein TerZ
MGSISLDKGQKLSLTKGGKGLTKVFMGLGWDPVTSGKKGFLGGLLGGGGGGGSIDLDASVIVMDAAKKELYSVSFSKLNSPDGAIRHGGDNLTGDGDGDDEVIYVDLEKLNPAAAYLVFTVHSFSGQTFNDVDNAVARLVDQASGDEEICQYKLTEKGAHKGVIMASLAKTANGWEMTAHGVPAGGRTVRDAVADAAAIL